MGLEYNIVDVIQRCGVKLKKSGRYYIGICPLHVGDTDPSLTIYTPTNSWTCFGACQGKNGHHNGGDEIEFVKQYYNYSYRQALEWLERNFTFYEPVKVEQKQPEVNKIVPPIFVLYWHSLMEEEQRQYFKSRGFQDWFIEQEYWGWDGHRYCLPVWAGEPGNSDCLGVRKRKVDVDGSKGFKYIGLKDMNPPTVWGRWYCRGQKKIYAFAGEFDAGLCNQDGLPAFSVVNGVNALSDFPKDWPDLWFPDGKELIVVFDKKEEVQAGKLAASWNRVKGSMMARVFHWPIDLDCKDYCEFRQTNYVDDFLDLILRQGL